VLLTVPEKGGEMPQMGTKESDPSPIDAEEEMF
jgi:hypothetical protein